MTIKTKSLIRAMGSVINVADFFGKHRQTVYDWLRESDDLPIDRERELKDRRADIYDAINQGEYDE